MLLLFFLNLKRYEIREAGTAIVIFFDAAVVVVVVVVLLKFILKLHCIAVCVLILTPIGF